MTGSMGAAGQGGSAGTSGGSGPAGISGGGGGAGIAAVTALVDDDQSDNNSSVSNPKPSPSDTAFPALLQNEGVAFQTIVSASDSSPAYLDLAGYANVVWYTGASKRTLSANQQQALEQWLDSGGKCLVIFSENMAGNLGGTWTSAPNEFLATYVGAAGSASDVYSFVRQDFLYDFTYVVSGSAGTPFASLTFSVAEGSPIASTADVINPATETITLATVSADPTFHANGDSPAPVAVGHTKGTSTVVYVGLPIENISAPPMNTRQQFFHATLVYLGIVN